MSRYYGHVVVTFTDGTIERYGGNRAAVEDNQLVVWTTRQYGPNDDISHLPLVNIREWHWDD